MYIKGVCSPNPCVNGGNCQVVDGDAICRCPDGFVGEHCELGISHDIYILSLIHI